MAHPTEREASQGCLMTIELEWSHETGRKKTRVVVYADPLRSGMLTLRWRQDGNWKRKTLGRAIETDRRGNITPDCEDFAVAAANHKSLELAGVIAAPGAAPKRTTIGEAEALVTDKDTGKYPHQSPFRDELVRAIRLAVTLWGADTPWQMIDEAQWTLLLRRRLEALVAKGAKAVRATEITISRLITVVRWLRRMKHIPRDAASWPDEWKKEVVNHWRGVTRSDRDPEPDRQRYTLDEFQRILKAADFDPRLDLLLRVAVGLRPGQVVRARRTDLDLPAVDWTVPPPEEGQSYGTLAVYGRGKKGGVVVDLTRGQRFALDVALSRNGYLGDIERQFRLGEIENYLLFPTGYIVGRVGMLRGKETTLKLAEGVDFSSHCTGSWIRKNWRIAEARAGVEHVNGRATYGGRRLSVDVGDEMGLSPSGLENLGGWSDTKIPSSIYRDRQNKAGRREARPVRARMLGEAEV